MVSLDSEHTEFFAKLPSKHQLGLLIKQLDELSHKDVFKEGSIYIEEVNGGGDEHKLQMEFTFTKL